jgi:hypothetical protein
MFCTDQAIDIVQNSIDYLSNSVAFRKDELLKFYSLSSVDEKESNKSESAAAAENLKVYFDIETTDSIINQSPFTAHFNKIIEELKTSIPSPSVIEEAARMNQAAESSDGEPVNIYSILF